MNRTIPCVLMRAGTSRGPFFLREWLPADEPGRDEALIGAIGASDLLQVDGVCSGSTLTSKVAIVSKSSQPGCDVDCLFAQVGVGQKSVDTRPNCGNMLPGVGPFPIGQGLMPAQDGETTVRVFNFNTRSPTDVKVLTPDRRVTYVGETGIDGAAGTAAPIRLDFLDEICRDALKQQRPLLDLLVEHPAINRHLDRAALARLCDPANYLGQSDAIVDRVLATLR